jgi:hypothetical protein
MSEYLTKIKAACMKVVEDTLADVASPVSIEIICNKIQNMAETPESQDEAIKGIRYSIELFICEDIARELENKLRQIIADAGVK